MALYNEYMDADKLEGARIDIYLHHRDEESDMVRHRKRVDIW